MHYCSLSLPEKWLFYDYFMSSEEGVLMFGGRLLEDGLPLAAGSSAKGTWLAFVSVLARLPVPN